MSQKSVKRIAKRDFGSRAENLAETTKNFALGQKPCNYNKGELTIYWFQCKVKFLVDSDQILVWDNWVTIKGFPINNLKLD